MVDFGGLAHFKEAGCDACAPQEPARTAWSSWATRLLEGWKLDEAFPGKLYVNRGISGQTTPQMLVRFRQDVIDLKPKVRCNFLAGDQRHRRQHWADDSSNRRKATSASMAELAAANVDSRGAVFGAAGI